MSFWDIEPSDWFRNASRADQVLTIYSKGFDEMRNRMEREFEEGFKQFESSVLKKFS